MNLLTYTNIIKEMYSNILAYIDNDEEQEANYQYLIHLFGEYKIKGNKHDLLLILYLLSSISLNHWTANHFFEKIEKIILHFENEIKYYFTDSQIFDIFKRNKRILLFLFEYKFISITEFIVKYFLQAKCRDRKYPEYFFPEIKQYIAHDQELYNKIVQEIPNDFETKRRKGENHDIMSQYIRDDLIEEIIIYKKRGILPINSRIQPSIYETHSYLLKNKPTLIEYAAFFGSAQIFNYLKKHGAKITKQLEMYAIHGNSQEIIDILGIYNFDGKNCFKESIKCHHNQMVNHFYNNFINSKLYKFFDDNNFKENCVAYNYKYYNFELISENYYDEFILNYLCKYNYYSFVELLLKNRKININKSVSNGTTALHSAAEKNNLDIVNLLLSQPDIQIGNNFMNCKKLTEIAIPSFISTLENNVFRGCFSLTQITIHSSVTSIGEGAFFGCSSLKQISIPSSVTYIKDNAFSECSSLEKISIPSSITLIGKYTFYGCSSLEQVSIPSSVTSIGDDAFSKCSSLKQISIPPSVASIGKYAFSCCSSLTQISIPSSIKIIEEGAFSGCSSLEQIKIPLSVTSIEDDAFSECSSLKQISIPQSVTSIGKYAFSGCSSLSQISIPSSVTLIGDDAFRQCASLTQISIPSSVKSIKPFTFDGCSSLKQVSIPSSVASIGKYAFSGCSSLTQISIPPSVTEIGSCAFKGCSSIEQFQIPSSVNSFGKRIFEGCDNNKTQMKL